MKSKQPHFRINDQIRTPEVRLIDAQGEQVGIVSLREALQMAEKAQLDLVEVAPMAKPPVCKIVDHGKVLFDQRRRQKLQKKKQHQQAIKEVKMKLKIDKHDYGTKVNRARQFMEKGDKVKFSIIFRGREMTHQDIGRELTNRVLADLADIGELEGMISRTGRLHSFMVARRKDYKPASAAPKTLPPASPQEPATPPAPPMPAPTGAGASGPV